jgi:hypothetical protein
MGKIEFKVCRVKANNKETKYENYAVDLNEISSIKLDGKVKRCVIEMKDGNVINIEYFDSNEVI